MGETTIENIGEPIRVAIQMDPIANMNTASDTTFALMLEAQNRGHYLTYYEPNSLTLKNDRLYANVFEVNVTDNNDTHYSEEGLGMIPLDEFDAILIRQDPPFDMAYITNTHLLEQLPPEVLVYNDPAGIRNAPEKLRVLDFADLMPPTIISSNKSEISDFVYEHRDAVIKPLHGHGGSGVFRLTHADGNLDSIVDALVSRDNCPVMVQPYLPDVVKGDKRIILVDGKPVGAINRIPAQGQTRANMFAGGTPHATTINEQDLMICNKISTTLRDEGLIFVGIDVIGGYLTEINVTSPTGARAIQRLCGIDVASVFWDKVELDLHDLNA